VSLAISSAGIVCSLGMSAPATVYAIAAGISGVTESRFFDNDDQIIPAASLSLLPFELPLEQRITELVSAAVLDCLERVVPTPGIRVGLFMGGPRPEWPSPRRRPLQSLVAAVREVLPPWVDVVLSDTAESGSIAGAQLLARARAAFESRAIDAALVCAGDSLLSPTVLQWLDDVRRLKLESRSDGLTPGEAAGCLWVTPATASTQAPQVVGVGFGREPATISNDEPLLGTGLADAVRAALGSAGFTFHDVDFRLADITGEAFGFREQTLLLARLLRQPRPAMPLWHPAEFIGSIGAASAVVHVALAAEALRLGFAPGIRGIVCSTDELGERSAVALRGVVT